MYTELYSNWLKRSEGSWKSYRRYLYGNPLENPKIQNLETEFDIVGHPGNPLSFTINWYSDQGTTGTMTVTIDGSTLYRSRGYYTEEETTTHLSVIDCNTVVFESSYNGMDFREEIRMLNNDTMRLRQTVGYKNGEVIISGQYIEVKK